MTPLFDLSLRYKLPIWGALLIGLTTVAISLVLMVGTYDEMREDLAINAEVVSRSADSALIPALAQDDLWHSYAFLAAVADIDHSPHERPVHASALLVVDREQRVIVSAAPRQFPMFRPLAELGPDYAAVARHLAAGSAESLHLIDIPDADSFHFVRRLAHGRTALGDLIVSYPKETLRQRFAETAAEGALVGLMILVLLLPSSWYWANRMSLPLAEVAGRIRSISSPATTRADPNLYRHKDEVGQLYQAYLWMLDELEARRALEDQLLRTERLAAVGQLAAGVAHEINNPLSGMLTAIDTLKQFGQGDFRTMKTIGLLERGLLQVKEIVGALLVQASVKGRHLSPHDLEDVRFLMVAQAEKKQVKFSFSHPLVDEVPVAATLVRQVMVNLLLNALDAAPTGGNVTLEVGSLDRSLTIVVANDGPEIPADRLRHIFEPFHSTRPSGHGLGLWVTYQIVNQLHGEIRAESSAALTRFSVRIPWEAQP